MSIIGSLLGIDGIGAAAQGVAASASEIIKRFVPDPDKALEAQQALTTSLSQSLATQMDAMARVMENDSKSDSPLTRLARPILVYWALAFITFIALFASVGDVTPMLHALQQVPDKLWDIVTYGVGIFAAGRSVEKVTDKIAGTIGAALGKRK